jgi:hypothetical protein
VALRNIDIVPTALATHNSCDLEMKSTIKVVKTEKKKQMTVADLTFEGSGKAAPFDPATGLWSPDLHLKILVKKDSLLGGLPVEKQLSKKDMEGFNENGISLEGIAIGGRLTEDATTAVHVVRGSKIIIQGDTRFSFPQYAITMLDDSWFNAPEDLINARSRLDVSPEVTQRILDGAKKWLAKKTGAETAAELGVELLATALVNEQDRLVLDFRAKGKMSDPEVRLDTVLSDVKDKLKDAGKNFLKGLFEQ